MIEKIIDDVCTFCDFFSFGIPKTSKKDKRNHGIGIHNRKQIVKKYDGSYHAAVDGGLQSRDLS